MKIFNKNHLAFTLIEVIVAVTILSIILISVMSIYITSTDINLKTDITRALQQNVKSVVEVISEDIRTRNSSIRLAIDKTDTDCLLEATGNETKAGMKLCI
jgi:prepilin-type N-terminal cleavage/methylation domain-containing protein